MLAKLQMAVLCLDSLAEFAGRASDKDWAIVQKTSRVRKCVDVNRLIQGDCVEELKKIDDDSVDLIFADPPYFLQLTNELHRPDSSLVDAVTDEWDKYSGFDEYDRFTKSWLEQCRRILKPSGTLWVIGSYHNIFRVGKEIQDLGFWILNDVIWVKSNPMPNFLGTRLNNSHETLIWASKDKKSKFTFNYKTLKSANEDKQMRSDWYIPICSGSEREKVNGQKAHSTQKPLALIRRILVAASKPGDVVLDPFLGSGTTAVAAKELGRNYIGIEREQKYIEVAKARLERVQPFDAALLSLTQEIKPPKVPFGLLVEAGYLAVGAVLSNAKGSVTAVVNANGSITSGGATGSIHKVGALVQDAASCNGWDYWHFDGSPISATRTKFLQDQE